MKPRISLLIILIGAGMLFAQEPSTKVIVRDEGKVGNIIAGTGNTINITQTILPKSQEYAVLQADSARLKKYSMKKMTNWPMPQGTLH